MLSFREFGNLKIGKETGEQLFSAVLGTHTKFVDSVHRLIWARFTASQNNYNSDIKGYWSQVTITNIIIMKRVEIL